MKKMALIILLGLSSASALSIKHERGTVQLTSPAKRVVALEYSFVDTLLSLGIQPVGAALGHEGGDRGAPPYLLAKTAGLNSVGSRAQPSLEKIAATRPDLILADATVQKELYPQLSNLAQTAAFQSRRGDLDDLNAQTLAIGKAVGQEAVARKLLADQASLRQKARVFTKKGAPPLVALVVTPKSVTAHTSGSLAGSFLEDLERKNQLPVNNGVTQYELSLEGLVALKPQTLVLFTAPDENPLTREWQKNPLWQTIPAVKRGRVYQFDRDNWTRGRGPMGLKLMIAQAIQSRLLQDGVPTGNFKY